jgi:myosin heavy subunit
MVAGTRIVQQVDGLDTLKDIVELVKNPDAITKAHALARKEMALTEEEQAKVDEARAFAKEYAQKASDHAQAQKNLEQAEKDHARRVSDFNQDYRAKMIELAETTDNLQRMRGETVDAQDAHEKIVQSFEKNRKNIEDALKSRQKELDDLIEKNRKELEAGKQANAEFAVIKARLKANARLLSEKAADFMEN